MSRETNSIVRICAFIALIILGVFAAVSLINYTGWVTIGGKFLSVLDFVKNIALVLTVILAAWDYTRDKGKATIIIFWIAVILILLMYFLPTIIGFFK